MSHIFISYSKQHRDLTEQLIAGLKAAGWADEQIWWDHRLKSGEPYSQEIADALAQAAAVVVIWTRGATKSDWVYAEANRARMKRCLVQVLDDSLSTADLPMPFDALHFERLVDRDRLISSIRKRLEGEKSEPPTDVKDKLILEDKRQTLIASKAAKAPSALLQARHEVVPFIDIGSHLADLIEWAISEEQVTGRLIHSPGGYGKTRLLIEALKILEHKHGWLNGFVPRDLRRHDARERQLARLITSGSEAPGLLLAVDYAESHQDDIVWLCERLLERESNGGPPARLVLLSRSAGEWWDRLYTDHDSVAQIFSKGLLTADTVSLELEIDNTSRQKLFEQALKAFSTTLGIRPSKVNSLSGLADITAKDRPLALQMRALLSLFEEDSSGALDKLIKSILGLERKYWKKKGRDEYKISELNRGATQITMVMGVGTKEDAFELLSKDLHFHDRLSPASLDPVVKDLSYLYGGTDLFIMPVEPDLIGEHLIALTVDDNLLTAGLEWCDSRENEKLSFLTSITRASRSEHGKNAASKAFACLKTIVQVRARSRLWVSAIIEVATEVPGQLPEAILSVVNDGALSAVELEHFIDALPLSSMRLANVSLAITRALVYKLDELESISIDASLSIKIRKSKALFRQAIADAGIGDHQSSLESAGFAVDELDNLNLDCNEEAAAIRAAALNVLGVQLGRSGEHEEARLATDEAIGIYSKLVESGKSAYSSHLAKALNNSGNWYLKLDKNKEALVATKKAVDIHRELARSNPEAYQPALAESLDNLGNRLAVSGLIEDAIKHTYEALVIRQRLCDKRPDSFMQDLARSLHNYSNRLNDLHRQEEALAAIDKAICLRRQLVEIQPNREKRGLGSSLFVKACQLLNRNDKSGAIEPLAESLAIFRQLAASQPIFYYADFQRVLYTFVKVADELGYRDRAIDSIGDAINLIDRSAMLRSTKKDCEKVSLLRYCRALKR